MHTWQALSCVAFDKNFPEALRVKSSGIKKSASLNLAAANLKRKDYKEVIKNCEKVRVCDKVNCMTRCVYV